MKIYGLKTCDTCRKALKQLPDAQMVDVRAEGVPAPVLSAAVFQRFSSRGRSNTGDKVLSAMRAGFGGHHERKDSSR